MPDKLIKEEARKLKIPSPLHPKAKANIEKASMKVSERILADDVRFFEKDSLVTITLTKEELIWVFWCLRGALSLSEFSESGR